MKKKPINLEREPYQEREVLGIYHAVDAITDMQFSEKYVVTYPQPPLSLTHVSLQEQRCSTSW